MTKYTDEQIKKALELCINWEAEYCEKCPFDGECENAGDIPLRNAFDLIRRQEAEIEELKTDLEAIHGLRNKRIYYRKFVDEEFRKQKGKELSDPDFDYIYRLYFEQKAEIEKLKDENATTTWRPASEPPKEEGSYLVYSCKSKTVFTARYIPRCERWANRANGHFITHWMPLPQPPKEVE